ncbi:amidophosphoribosyltransferase [Candidatus Nitrosocosmicus agrestis]|jgi:amidophosphoribosyltransferase|uniref:amidophosphoribosyltransferase n=1 Tax=Candidatus Nitrosocosmicus agrestis TaxID=2563600 RepID=UPI00122E7C2F|nr:amidophosphoribosyltransferase [Candidatus Nitrosocosmicus sp. SS]KAA2279564.1 amidophosphoribosyltransferase [Candidatus Nitrosocosmicus sp. SS]KAF0868154.1 amidophosphoribosyltransferase [Candidatus Nitrosocosmicus sp. SS]
MVHENCGVVGIYSLGGVNVIPYLIDCLRSLQHRGQESWGIAVPKKIPYKKTGLVSRSANEFENIITKYSSNIGIGHVRYSTFGSSSLENAQPLKVKDLCVAHNGTITNAQQLSNLVGGCTFTPQNMTDTLVAAQRLVEILKSKDDMKSAMTILKKEMIGSYCFTFLTDSNTIYAARDPKGFRPMVLGHHKDTNTFIIASESCAFSSFGAILMRDIQPGELIRIDQNGIRSETYADATKHAHCAFEFTYFAHPSSIMEGINIYLARKKIGEYLAEKYPISDADVVIPVPDSSRPAALGYSLKLGIPFEEGLLKDRYSKKGSMRSFIEPLNEDRKEINQNILPIREVIQNKHVIIVDDSIVRGTSSRAIIESVKSAGAKKISMVVTYPPISYPCYAGIDFPSQEELIAFQVARNETNLESIGNKVSKIIGANTVLYNDNLTLAKGIGLKKSELCFSCSTGDYSPLGITPNFNLKYQINDKLL